MNKLILASILGVAFSSGAISQEVGYLRDNSGSVVKSGFGLCWNVSGTKTLEEECGDKKPEQPAQVVKQPKMAEVPVAKEQIKLTIDAQVLFAFDSSKLTESGKKILDKELLGKELREVVIAGHTDQIGTEKYNMALGQRRADSVKSYLVSKGLDKSIVTAKSFGETQLLRSCAVKDRACNAANRRVEITAEVK